MTGNERTVFEIASKITYCTNAGPDQAATPTLTLPGDTLAPAWETVNGTHTNSLQYVLQSTGGGGSQIEWLWTNGLAEETITGVLVYSYDIAGYVETQAFPWHYQPVTPHLIVSGQDIRFGNAAAINLLSKIRLA